MQGFTIVVFSISRKMPDANEVLQISVSGFFVNCTHFFRMGSITQPNPDELFPFSFFTTFSTLFSDTGLMNIVCGHVFIFKFIMLQVVCVPLLWSVSFSIVSTKYELNNSAVALGFDILFFPHLNSVFLLFINDFPSSLFIICHAAFNLFLELLI